MEFLASPWVAPALGFLVGMIGALVGMGGGFFVVPYLVLVHAFAPTMANGTSLWLVVANSTSATVRYAAQGQVMWLLGAALGVSTLPGAYLGTVAAQYWSAGAFRVAFGALLAAACLYVFALSGSPRLNEDPGGVRIRLGLAAMVSVFTGFVSSIFGVGGGIIHVPLLMFLCRMPMRMSTATSQWALLMTSLVGAAAYAARGQTDWGMVALLAPGVILGAQVGVWAGRRVNVQLIRRAFATICLVVAVEMLWER